MMKLKHHEKSFTLIETIAAALLLSVSVVILSGISVHSLRAGSSMMHYEQAWDLADRQLTMVDYMGVRQQILDGPTEGVFEGDGVEFDWKLEVSETTVDFLYDVKVTVGWVQQQRYRTIQAQTRLNGIE